MADQRDGGIAWTDVTWNPVRGCSRVSEGCTNCYAEVFAARYSFAADPRRKRKAGPYHGLALYNTNHEARWTGRIRFVAERLADPFHWRRPRRVFVNSMSDLFHEKLTNGQIAAVFGMMSWASRHTFQVLTKRPERAREWFAWVASQATSPELLCRQYTNAMLGISLPGHPPEVRFGTKVSEELGPGERWEWPPPNVHFGVSCENQKSADERIPFALQCPATVRWVSAEPLLGPIDFTQIRRDDGAVLNALTGESFKGGVRYGGREEPRLDWIVVGGESGPGARPCSTYWVRDIVGECREASVPVFVKQMGANHRFGPIGAGCAERIEYKDRAGADPSEWPQDLRVREFP